MLTVKSKVNINHPLHLYSSLKLSDAATSIRSCDLIFTAILGVRGGSQPRKTAVEMFVDGNLRPE